MPRFVVSGDADLLAIRFACSPLWEAHEAVRSLVDARSPRGRNPWHDPWRELVGAPAAALHLDELEAVSALETGWVPDFLTPPPEEPAPSFDQQLAVVRSTPIEQVVRELELCRDNPGSSARRATLARLIADPLEALETLADQLGQVWEVLVAPFWPRISALIDNDVDYRSRRLARRGLRGMLAELHPDVRWADGVIDAAGQPDEDVELAGRGLVLMPSAYVWPSIVAITAEPWQPTIVYPARGVGELWAMPARPPRALEQLLGRGRAVVLVSLAEPASTTALAARCARSVSGVSGHLQALRAAGLVTGVRNGHEVRYGRTDLGDALVRGQF